MATRGLSYSLLLVLTALAQIAIPTTSQVAEPDEPEPPPSICEWRLSGRARAASRGRRTSPHRALPPACQPGTGSPGEPSSCSTAQRDPGCCEDGRSYGTYACSPRVMGNTSATLTLNGFPEGRFGGGRSRCHHRLHPPDSQMVVALSTGWFSHGRRCGKQILIRANGRTARATVVDECDSLHGCGKEHDFKAPCGNSVVDATWEVWEALGFACDSDDDSEQVTWSDA